MPNHERRPVPMEPDPKEVERVLRYSESDMQDRLRAAKWVVLNRLCATSMEKAMTVTELCKLGMLLWKYDNTPLAKDGKVTDEAVAFFRKTAKLMGSDPTKLRKAMANAK